MKPKRMLALVLMASSLLMSGCSNGPAKSVVLKVLDDFKGECEINTPIDVGYFFYCSDNKVKTVSVTYNNGEKSVTDQVYGEIFIPSFAGKHVFVCSANGQSVSKEVNVVDQKPFISVDTSTYFHVVEGDYRDIYLEDLTQNISCTLSPSTAKLRLDKVEYAPYNLKLDKEDTKYTEVPFVKDHFTATNNGHYRVHVSSVNGSRTAQGMFNVIVDTNINNGNQYVKKPNPESKKYCSRRVVVDSTNPDAFLLPAADWRRGASFVTLSEEIEYTDDVGREMPKETIIQFKGKNIPSIGIYTQADPISGSFSNTAISEGYIVTWEQNGLTDRFSITEGSGTYVYKTVYSNHPEYLLGIQDLDDDAYYRLKIGLRTMYQPNGDNDYLHDVRWTIEKINGYGTPEVSYEKLSERDYWMPFNGWWDTHGDRKGYITFYSSSLKDITFEVVRD